MQFNETRQQAITGLNVSFSGSDVWVLMGISHTSLCLCIATG